MRNLRTYLVLAVLAVLPGTLLAQQRTVSGQVTAADTGEPLMGVTVMVPGTQIGTLTNTQGRYELEVPQGEVTLSFQSLGYRTVTRTTSAATLDVALETAPIELEGLTVTAMGIARERRSLGYTLEEIDAEEVSEIPADNFVSNLQGKIAGAVIKSSPYAGGSTRIVLRGANSLLGNNEPIFVVDGVVVDNSSGGATASGGFDYGNAIGMLDPSDIKSISVLKGANAAALYGSRASNGVILIETKTGADARPGVTASQTVEMTRPLRLPSYQNRYGQGRTNCAMPGPDCAGEFRFVDGLGGGVNDGVDESWGPPMDCQPVDQFFGAGEPFCPHPDNVSDFFQTGWTTRTHAALNASSDNSHGRFAVTYENADGMAPGNQMEKAQLQLRGGFELSERATVNATAHYIRDTGERRPAVGYDGRNFMQQFNWFGRQVDIHMLEDWECVDNRFECAGKRGGYSPYANWNYNYHDNPYFLQYGNNNFDQTDRIIGSASGSYELLSWLSAEGRTGVDWYREQRNRQYHVGSQSFIDGGFLKQLIYNREHNTSARLSTTPIELPEGFALSVNTGGNVRIGYRDFEQVNSTQLSVPGIYTVANSAGIPNNVQTTEEKKVYSLFGDAELSFNDWAFVNVTGRNDWSSTLPEDNRSYFYPSVSTSVVFTDALGIDSDVLTFGKVRGSWARVGNDTDPYQLRNTFSKGVQWGSTVGYTVPNTSKNPNLKPEQTDSWEFGGELELWGGRAGLSYTWYRQTTKDQILPVQVSFASGYNSTVINAGKIRNEGHEVKLTGTPVRTDDFSWDVGVNWGKNDNEVVSLAGDLENIVLGDFFGITLEARVGEPYGTINGWDFNRDDQGRLILYGEDPALPATDYQKQVLGDVNPDWTGSVSNQLTYKDFDFSFLFDISQGGEIFATTNWFGYWTGVLDETLQGRENGACDPGVLVEGVTPEGEPISNRVCPERWWSTGSITYQHIPRGIFDASYIKLRQARIGYQLPDSWARAIGFQNMHVSVIGRNLWLNSEVRHIDPDFATTNGNYQGVEYGIFPSGRTVGMTLSVVP